MATVAEIETVADLLEQLGNVPAERIRMRPAPGTATEADVIALASQVDKRFCELIDGTLVEKAIGLRESLLAFYLASLLNQFVEAHDLGMMAGADGMVRLWPGRIRIPDGSYISWDRLRQARVLQEAVPTLAPELVVEVLSESNTRAEMERKRHEYFSVGVRLVWEMDLEDRTITVYTDETSATVLTVADTLTGGEVLPGFAVAIATIFARLDRLR